MTMRYLLLAAFFVTGGVSASTDCHFKLKETVSFPRGWVKQGSPSPDHNINLHIGLPQPNFDLLEKHLYEVSDPGHERYGQHLSKEEVEALVAPHQESVDSVDKWLSSFGIRVDEIQRSPARDWAMLTIPVRLAEEMLNTTYSVWKHLESGDSIVRTTSYSLPDYVHEHVDVVQPTTMFGRFKSAKSTIVSVEDAPEVKVSGPPIDVGNGIMVDPSCNTTITVDCLKQLYNGTSFVGQGKGSIGITGYLGENANIQDLQSFFADQRPDALGSTFKFFSVNGGINNQSLAAAGGEANLDTQFAFGISHPVPGTFYSTAGQPPFNPDVLTPTDTNEPYLDWLNFILNHPNPPLTISTSYGDNEQTVPESFAQRACQGFAQLGARGVSMMFSSGDSGVGDGDSNPATQQCFSNDGRNVTMFIPAFPASCPFVTAVGATTNIVEVAVSRFFSGGGFSNYVSETQLIKDDTKMGPDPFFKFARPAYQEKVVTNYLKTKLPHGTYAGLFNPKGRAYPDVSAQGDRFRVFLGGRAVSIGGTSASSPTFTGFVALLNDARLSKGLPPLGFLNPLLYSNEQALNDITVGHNSGCGTTGFNVTEGWDPVTGLGTPNFGKLLAVVTGVKY